ncbi:alanine racemase C-terminal domain-containing protein [Escherichia coli]
MTGCARESFFMALPPLEDRSTGADFGCQPVMSLTSSLIAVREHKAGEPVGYGGTWVSERDTRLGVVAMGYGDGYPRAAPSGTPVLVNGREVPIVGRVAMDMDRGTRVQRAQDKAGDPVILWGEGLPVERIAEMTKEALTQMYYAPDFKGRDEIRGLIVL